MTTTPPKTLLINGQSASTPARRLSRVFHDELACRHGAARRRDAAPAGSMKLLPWGQRYLPAHFSRPPSAMHRWLSRRLDALGGKRGVKIKSLCPISP